MTNPNISIALTTYNGQLYIEDQINSILNQTLPPFEIVIVDDNSIDNTCDIIGKIESNIPIRLYVNKENLGVNSNFEKAILLCKGDYISISDQDDIWINNKIEVMINTALKYNNDLPILVCSNSFMMNKDLTINYGPVFTENTQKGLYKKFFHPNSQGAGMLFNSKLKDIILPFPKDIHAYDFYIGIIAEIYGINKYIKEPLMNYRIHDNNAVGISEILPLKKRFFKALTGNYNIYVPGAFITLKSIINRDSFKIDVKNHQMITNILCLVSSELNTIKKIHIIIKYRFASPKSRILICLKLIINNILTR